MNVMSVLKFNANISFMFKEFQCLLDRYEAASKAGFKGVECSDEIYDYEIGKVVEAKKNANVEQVLINSYGGCKNSFTINPGQEEQFKKNFEISLEYAKALNCKKIHVTSGLINTDEKISMVKYEETYIRNLRYCASEAKKDNITVLIEPITTIPCYFLTKTDQALKILEKVDCDNVKLQFDFFHAQRIHGNLTTVLKENFPFIGHIQISQVPDRGEPNTSGEINYFYIFNLLSTLHYDQWIGCEYKPIGKTENGLTWFADYKLNL